MTDMLDSSLAQFGNLADRIASTAPNSVEFGVVTGRIPEPEGLVAAAGLPVARTAEIASELASSVVAPSHRQGKHKPLNYPAVALVGDLIIATVVLSAVMAIGGGTVFHPVAALLVWPLSIWANRGYESKFVGSGTEEFRKVFHAGVALLCVVAMSGVLLKWQPSRSGIAFLVVAIFATLSWRYLLRQALHRRNRRGLDMRRVLLVGHQSAAEELLMSLRRETHHGLDVVGVCVPCGQQSLLEGVLNPAMIMGSFDDVERVVAAEGIDVVAVLSCPEFDGAALRQLVWSLEPLGVALLVAPASVEVAGPRLSVRPAAGLPLLHLEAPELAGARRVLKSSGDRLGALLGLIVLSPLLVLVGLAIRIDSPGSVIFRQRRVGRDGIEFTMLKFRSMCVDAEARLDEVAHLDSHGTGQLFKIKGDPRITKVGAFIRRFSIDEFPQLVNVLRGEMSLVGPRPPLPREVEVYEVHAMPRLRVKPGLTGLWQVSGRSDLTVEESVRLDLRYVENWSLMMDFMILWKTARAVLGKSGAY